MEWTNKAGGVIEIYDGKTKKTHLGKYDLHTRDMIKKPIKTRIAHAIKYGFNKVKTMPLFFYFEPGVD